MKNKATHTSPCEYRIRYLINGAVTETVQYYNVFHSSEALDYLAHTFRREHIEGNKLTVVAVEEFDRFAKKWVNRTPKAAQHCEAPELKIKGDEIWLLKKN